MKIKNPTKEPIEVLIKGTTYRIEAEGTLNNVPDEAAEYWQSLHKFLELRKEKVEDVKVEIPAPVVEAVIEAKAEVEDVKVEVETEPSDVSDELEVKEAAVVAKK